MGTVRPAALAAATTTILALPLLPSAAAEPDCFRIGTTCHPTMAAALAIAVDGDTIEVPAGTFPGGVVVTKSVTISGAGQALTRFEGGGPVITVGEFGDTTPPTVTIRDLTISGGRTTSSALSTVLTGEEGVWAAGGGIAVPPSSFDFETGELGLGATLTLVRTTVEDNAVAPAETVPSGLPCPGGEDCPFALAAGGGIDSSGHLTLDHTTVRDNHAGSGSGISDLASDSEGGGIRMWVGRLTLRDSWVGDNSSVAVAPNGRFAEGGGIMAGGLLPVGDDVVVRNSRVVGNVARLDSGLPDEANGEFLDQVAIGGGLHLSGEVPSVLLDHATVEDNVVSATNSVGSATAFAGGVLTNGSTRALVVNSSVRSNTASAETLIGSTGLAHADTAGIQLYGRMVQSTVAENTVRARSSSGDAEALAGGLWTVKGDVLGSTIRGNTISADAPNGTATVRGGGAVVDHVPEDLPGGLTLRSSSVSGNVGSATGESTVAQGGGIFDALISLETGPAGGPLTLVNVVVTENRLTPAATAEGGGMYVDSQPLQLRQVHIVDNSPDDCVGCGTTTPGSTLSESGALRSGRSAGLGVRRSVTQVPRLRLLQ